VSPAESLVGRIEHESVIRVFLATRLHDHGRAVAVPDGSVGVGVETGGWRPWAIAARLQESAGRPSDPGRPLHLT
jgi:hypothetical protein